MPIYDSDESANRQFSKLFDNTGINSLISKVYDNDGTTNNLIYTADEIITQSTISKSAGYQSGCMAVYPVDVTNYEKLQITAQTTLSPRINGEGYTSIGLYNSNSQSSYWGIRNALVKGKGDLNTVYNETYTVDVSSLSGIFYIGCASYGISNQSCTAVLFKVVGEY